MKEPSTIRWQRLPPDDSIEQILHAAVAETLRRFDVQNPGVAFLLADDECLCILNRDWRGLDRPTDVLSFAEREGEALVSPSSRQFLGDIAISLDTARRQSEEYGHSLEREIAFLAIHGLLHLLGYDHQSADEEREMFALQREILGALAASGACS